MIKQQQLFCQAAHQVAIYSDRKKLSPDELLGETAVVVLLFYFVLTCSV